MNTAETIFGGSFCSGRNVWKISGRGWKKTSSACWGGGCEAGRTRSKRSTCKGVCTKEPMYRETLRGSSVVGGSDDGGRAMFYVARVQRTASVHN